MLQSEAKHNPQNPYKSFLVSASAGCGKTYQLSQRFLSLVATGSSPSSILTITFTKKAANEMRARIIADAARLRVSSTNQSAFNDTMRGFHSCTGTEAKPPLDALEVADLILHSTQQLRIGTIDALFYQWLKRFSLDTQDQNLPMYPQLMDEAQDSALNEKAWDFVFSSILKTNQSNANIGLQKWIEASGVFHVRNRCMELMRLEGCLWLKQQLGESLFEPWSTEAYEKPDLSQIILNLKKLSTELSPSFQQKVALLSADDAIWNFRTLGIVNAEYRISGSYLRANKREKNLDLVLSIEDGLRAIHNHNQRHKLDLFGLLLTQVYQEYCAKRNQLKYKEDKVDFNDLAKAAFLLINNPDNDAVRYLIHMQTKHILFDEFQDTNRLQWMVFSELSREMLSGMEVLDGTGAPPTVFLVGDEKQSIYGFREADPDIIEDAALEFSEFGLDRVPLNANFRSSPHVLNFINHVFSESDIIDDFPEHIPARHHTGDFINEDIGFVRVYNPCMIERKSARSTDEDIKEEDHPSKIEANLVAQALKRILDENEAHIVFDKLAGGYRPIEARDCAIIFREGTRIHYFEEALKEQRISFTREQSHGLFERPEIGDMMALINYIAYPSDSLSLLRFLKSPMIGIDDSYILQLCNETKVSKDHPDQRNIEILRRIENARTESLPLFWHYLRVPQKCPTPSQLISEVLQESSINKYFQLYSEKDAQQALANLFQFSEICESLTSQSGSSYQSLAQSILEMAEKNILGNASASTNSVNLLSIHKSKGLEYPLVIIVDLMSNWEKADDYWLKVKNQNERSAHSIYYVGTKEDHPIEDSYFDSIRQKYVLEQKKESARLLYVALTRARHYLIATGSAFGNPQESFFENYLDLLRASLKSHPQATQEKDRQDEYWELRSTPSANLKNTDQMMRRKSFSSIESGTIDSQLSHQLSSVTPTSMLKQRTVRKKIEPLIASKTREHEFPEIHGLLVHRILEFACHGLRCSDHELDRIIVTQNKTINLRSQQQLIETAKNEAEITTRSESWLQMICNASALRPEQEFCYSNQTEFYEGRIDLIVEKEALQEVWVIDFKTGDEDRNRLQQLKVYSEAMCLIYPEFKVRCFFFFTSHPQLKEIEFPANAKSKVNAIK